MSDSASSTQAHLKIAGIEEGVVILHDGSLAVVLQTTPINFGLKNELEQNAIIAKYQGFLNSLDFPIQIVVRSKRLDLEPYLLDLEQRVTSQTNELLQIQSEDYISFMRNLVQVANIMSKSYYVVISYKRVDASTAKTGLFAAFSHKSTGPTITRSQFNHLRDELNARANTAASGLSQMGLGVSALDTQQLIELFYAAYNPDISATERLAEMDVIGAEVVSTGAPATQAAPPTDEAAPKSDAITLNTSGSLDIGSTVNIAAVSDQAQMAVAEPDSTLAAQTQAQTPQAPPEAAPQPTTTPDQPTMPVQPAPTPSTEVTPPPATPPTTPPTNPAA